MKLLLLLPVFTLMACGQLAPTKKNGYTMNSASSSISGCTSLQPAYNSPVDSNLTGYSVCATSDSTSVVIRYSLASSGVPVCVYPDTNTLPRCFTPSTTSGSITLQWLNLAFSSVTMIEQRDQGTFEAMALSYSATNVARVTAKFR